MSLTDTIQAIQRAVGAAADGRFGPETAALVWRALNQGEDTGGTPVHPSGLAGMDERSIKNLRTLDPKARGAFEQFYNLANATAASLGCAYILIGGNRSWEEQDALYAQGRTAPGEIVTRARGGASNHNFGIAGDFGVFIGKVYLDGGSAGQTELASRVHKACSIHAAACGLEWGGSWTTFKDAPHYEVATGLTLTQKRNVFKERGSVL